MHYFVSYSTADAIDFVLKLADELKAGPPTMTAWVAAREIRACEEWDTKIDQAIRTCECLIFVMTLDSVDAPSICNNEWKRALKFKKQIVPILLHKDVVIPFRLDSRQYIDFSSDFNVGLAKLRKYLGWLGSDEGQLQILRDRLNDAQFDLNRAMEEEKSRVQRDVDDLKERIVKQELIIKNASTARAQAQQSIVTRIEGERQSPPQSKTEKRAKFINPPPMMAPAYFQDRCVETKLVADFLRADSQRIITLFGRGGVGKTAMACRILKALEHGQLPDDIGELDTDGIIYLSEIGTHRIGFPNLFADLCRLLPIEKAAHLEKIYKDKQRPIRLKMFSLLEEFRDDPVIVLLDNLENLIDLGTRSLIQEDLKEAIIAILEAPHHTVKIIITTRIPLQDIRLIHSERQMSLPLDGGLNYPFAENLLRSLDQDGIIGLKIASDSQLAKIREATRGFPRALEAFFGVLAADRSTSIEELLTDIQHMHPQKVVEDLVGEAFSRLDKTSQMVMQALAIYARPVPPVAVDYLLQPYLDVPDFVKILNVLVNMHFVRLEMGKYYLHPVDLAYALSLVPTKSESSNGSPQPGYSQITLKRRASEYFHEISRPRTEWNTLADIEPQLSEFELRCAAGDFEIAFRLINEIGIYMLKWGHPKIVIDMRQKLLNRLNNEMMECWNLIRLGIAYQHLGRPRQEIEYLTQAMYLNQKIKDQSFESIILSSLGIAHRMIGQISRAILFYNKSLLIDQELHDRLSECIVLNNLATAHGYLGNHAKAIEHFEHALEISHELSNMEQEGTIKGNMSISLLQTGQIQNAIVHGERALAIARRYSNRSDECVRLDQLGLCYLSSGDFEKGIKYLESALAQAREIADSYRETRCMIRLCAAKLIFSGDCEVLEELAQAEELSREIENGECEAEGRVVMASAELCTGQLEGALHTLEPVFNTEYGKHLLDILTLSGIIHLLQSSFTESAHMFSEAILQADSLLQNTPSNYLAHETKGIAYCGLALQGDKKHLDSALSCYRQAREIITTPGVVRRALFYFNELSKADKTGLLSNVRKALEGA